MKVFLYSSPAHIPFSFARHFWFVIEENGEKHRYEVLFYENPDKKLGYIHIDQFPPDVGLGIFPLLNGYTWKGVLEKIYTGESAKNLIKVIKKSVHEYPFIHEYKLTGPNSNTYVQWILDQSGIDFRLPWNAIGRDFYTLVIDT